MSLCTSSLSVRVFATSVLATLGLGYSLAMVYLYAQEVRPHRLQGHGLVQGVADTYHGIPTESRLLVSLRGTMATTVSKEEFRAIEEWALAGAPEADYAATVEPIVVNNCMSCHAADGYFPKLETYADVKVLTEPDSGKDVKQLARMTHVHLLGIPMLFFILGSFFVRTRFSEPLKAVLVALPFAAVIWDIAHWWITKMNPSAAAGVILGGVVMGIAFGLQWLFCAWDLWMPLRGESDDAPG